MSRRPATIFSSSSVAATALRNVARGFDIYLRIGKTTIDEDHIGDFARGGFTWPVGIAISKSDGSVFASDEYECTISAFDPDGIQTFPEYDPDGEYFERVGHEGFRAGHDERTRGDRLRRRR